MRYAEGNGGIKESVWVGSINGAPVSLKWDLSWTIRKSALYDLNVITGCAKKCRICVINWIFL